MKGQGLITREGVRFFIFFHSFMMPYRFITLISALEEFHFFVTVGPSAPFGPALNPTKIENFKWCQIDLIIRALRVPKTV